MDEWSSQIKEMLEKALFRATEDGKSRIRTMLQKLDSFKVKNKLEIYTANDYDQMWKNELDHHEVAYFDTIVLEFYNDLQATQSGDPQIQQ